MPFKSQVASIAVVRMMFKAHVDFVVAIPCCRIFQSLLSKEMEEVKDHSAAERSSLRPAPKVPTVKDISLASLIFVALE
jgi:hypothetical protein